MSLTNPSFSNLSCEICFDPFDLETHLPKSLSCCGKSICKKCLSVIQQEQTNQCPWCKCRTNLSNENCKTNFQLLNIIEEELKWEKCSHHQENMKLVCIKDKHKVCSYCGYLSECKNHELVHLMSLKPASDQRLKELQVYLERIENKIENYDKIFGEKKVLFQNLICDGFDKQIYELQKAKAKALIILNSTFNSKWSNTLEENSSLRTELEDKIFNHQNFLKTKNPIDVIEEDLSSLKCRADSLVRGSQENEYFMQNLSRMISLFQQQIERSFLGQKETIDAFISSLQDTTEPFKPVSIDCNGELQVQVSGLSFEFNKTLNGKKLLSCKHESDRAIKTIKLKMEEIKEVRGIQIDLKNLDLSESNLRALECSFAQIPKLRKVFLISEFTPESQKIEKLSNLFSIVFKNPQDIDKVWIQSLANNNFALLLNIIMPQLTSLKSLKIETISPEISAENFENLIENLILLAPGLEELSLNLSGTHFSASTLKKLMFISMPKMESFSLNLSKIIYFDDEILSRLTDNIQNLMPQMKQFKLKLFQTKVSSKYVSALKNKIGYISGVYIRSD